MSEIDPQENQNESGEEIPLCPGCMEPVDKLSYYCPRCGAASGQLTPYMPFVNIGFYVNFYSRLWSKIWYERSSILLKLFGMFLILWAVPVVLILLPFTFYDKLTAKKVPPAQDTQNQISDGGQDCPNQ